MGMDVSGLNPSSETGEYFRNNIWWWRHLWSFSIHVMGEDEMREHAVHCFEDDQIEQIREEHGADFDPRCPSFGFSNDGYGLNAEGAAKLASLLSDALTNGQCADVEQQIRDHKASLPMEACHICDGSGIRTDDLGIENGWHTVELDEVTAAVVGRTRGSCNSCKGYGKVESFLNSYQFDAENVASFASFCKDSGGFMIF